MAVFTTATGVALAQDTTERATTSSTQSTSSTADPTTSTADPTTSTADPTTSTADPTTSTADRTTSTSDPTTTTTDDLGTKGGSSEGSTDANQITTTTSEELNGLVQPRAHNTTATQTVSGSTCAKADSFNANSHYLLVIGSGPTTVNILISPANNFGGTWESDIPFTGEIRVKSAQITSTTAILAATTGSFTTPATNQNNQPQDISHIEFCGVGVPTTTQTTTTTGTTTTQTTTTDTTTTDTTTTDTTTTDTTTTDTTTDTTTGTTTTGTTTGTGTTPVAGTTGAGGGGAAGTVGGGGGGGGDRGDRGDVAGVAAGEARAVGGGLPFTGLHAPLMVLVALAMSGAGLALRKRIGDSG